MKFEELKEEISIELEYMETVIQEVVDLRTELGTREPTVREKTAAAAFMAQFYSGLENILKRISYFYQTPLPTGDTWHLELFKRFCQPAHESFPLLFDEALEPAVSAFRKFRHVFYHGYGFHLDWDRMREGITTVDDVFARFKLRLHDFMQTLPSS